MIDIKSLFLSKGSKDKKYISGWNDAICFINDNYQLEDRKKGKAVGIVLSLNLDEDYIVNKILKGTK